MPRLSPFCRLSTTLVALLLYLLPGMQGQTQMLQTDTSTQVVADTLLLPVLPDTIRIERYDPEFPVLATVVPDSNLSLDYVRYDPQMQTRRPTPLSLQTIGQPYLDRYPLSGYYQRFRQLGATTDQPYFVLPLPFYRQNLAFSYTAYDQGSEIDDGQIRVLFGRPFAGGWNLGLSYRRTYQDAQRSTYPESRAQRTALMVGLSRAPATARHRSFLWLKLQSHDFLNSGGYDFALSDSAQQAPAQAYLASPLLSGVVSKGRDIRVGLLHRYCFSRQTNTPPRGFALALSGRYKRQSARTTVSPPVTDYFGPFAVDERGLRFAPRSSSWLVETNLEYYGKSRGRTLSVRLGPYAGSQTLASSFLPARSIGLLGVAGRLHAAPLSAVQVDVRADLPLGQRRGSGRIQAAVDTRLNTALKLTGFALLERSEAPMFSQHQGVNATLIAEHALPIATHARVGIGGSTDILPINVRLFAEYFANATGYGAFGVPQVQESSFWIPSAAASIKLSARGLTLQNDLLVRARADRMQNLYLPRYTGRHSLYQLFRLFRKRMELIAGVDARVGSPAPAYGYFPLTGAFTTTEQTDTTSAGWQYRVDAFVAFRVKSFKFFLRADNLLVDRARRGATVYGYPAVRSNLIGSGKAYLRLGASFFLFN